MVLIQLQWWCHYLYFYCSYKLVEIWKTRLNILISDLIIPKYNHNSLSAYSFLFFLSLSLRTASPDEATQAEMYIVTVKKLLTSYVHHNSHTSLWPVWHTSFPLTTFKDCCILIQQAGDCFLDLHTMYSTPINVQSQLHKPVSTKQCWAFPFHNHVILAGILMIPCKTKDTYISPHIIYCEYLVGQFHDQE